MCEAYSRTETPAICAGRFLIPLMKYVCSFTQTFSLCCRIYKLHLKTSSSLQNNANENFKLQTGACLYCVFMAPGAGCLFHAGGK